MNYFESIKTEEEAKARYRKLAVKHHPDKGGNASIFVEIKEQYEKILQDGFGFSYSGAKQEAGKLDELLKMYRFLNVLDGIVVELTGEWLWVSGNTYDYKDKLKEYKFSFSKKHKKWYKAPYEIKKKRRSNYSFNKIKDVYGYESRKISNQRLCASDSNKKD